VEWEKAGKEDVHKSSGKRRRGDAVRGAQIERHRTAEMKGRGKLASRHAVRPYLDEGNVPAKKESNLINGRSVKSLFRCIGP